MLFRNIYWLVPLALCVSIISCAPENSTSNPTAPPDEIDALISRPNCKVTLKSEPYNYNKLDQYKIVEHESFQTLEILPNGKVAVDEEMTQCMPASGPWGCRQVHAATAFVPYLKMPKGIMMLDDANEPVMLLSFDMEKKKAELSYLKRKMQDMIGKETLKFDLNSCKK